MFRGIHVCRVLEVLRHNIISRDIFQQSWDGQVGLRWNIKVLVWNSALNNSFFNFFFFFFVWREHGHGWFFHRPCFFSFILINSKINFYWFSFVPREVGFWLFFPIRCFFSFIVRIRRIFIIFWCCFFSFTVRFSSLILINNKIKNLVSRWTIFTPGRYSTDECANKIYFNYVAFLTPTTDSNQKESILITEKIWVLNTRTLIE